MRLTDIEEMPSLVNRSKGARSDTATEKPVTEHEDTIGAILRNARARAELDLRDVAKQLRIRHAYLEAIEQGRYRDLPGLTYGIGFVRTYADYLGLDKNRSVELFKQESRDLAEPTTLSFPSPAPEGKVPGGALVFVSALLAVLVYAGWYYATTENRSLVDIVPEIPERLRSLVTENSVPDAATPDTAAQVASTGAGVTATPPDSREARAETPPSPEETFAETALGTDPDTDTTGPRASSLAIAPTVDRSTRDRVAAAATLAPPAGSETYRLDAREASVATGADRSAAPLATSGDQLAASVAATGDGTGDGTTGDRVATVGRPGAASTDGTSVSTSAPLVVAAIPAAPTMTEGGSVADGTAAAGQTSIVIRATGDSWVQIRDADAASVMTRIMRDGDEYRVPNREGLRLLTGNAGALEITVDGQPVARLGDFGEVVRNIQLDRSLLDRKPR